MAVEGVVVEELAEGELLDEVDGEVRLAVLEVGLNALHQVDIVLPHPLASHQQNCLVLQRQRRSLSNDLHQLQLLLAA